MFINTEAGTFRPRVLDTTGQEIFVRFVRNFASDLPARFFLSLLLLFVFVHCLLLLPYFQILFSLLLCNCSCPSHFASSFLLACLNFQRPTFSAAITEHFASDIFLVGPRSMNCPMERDVGRTLVYCASFSFTAASLWLVQVRRLFLSGIF